MISTPVSRLIVLSVAITAGLACSSIEERDQERTLQSEMIRSLNEKTPEFAECAKDHNLFSEMKADRVRVEMLLNIGSRGRVDRFQIDNKDYPGSFVDCMFETAEEAEFPELKPGETVELTQPFIFTK